MSDSEVDQKAQAAAKDAAEPEAVGEPTGELIRNPDDTLEWLAPITDEEREQMAALDKEHSDIVARPATKLRFLRAFGKKSAPKQVKAAAKAIGEHLEWEASIKPRQIVMDDIRTALDSGTWRFMGKTDDGYPVIWVQVQHWNPHQYTIEQYEKYVAYFCSRSEHQMNGVTRHVVVFDMAGWAMWHARYVSYIKRLTAIVLHQYPERLEKVLVLNAPLTFRGVWAVIKPLLDQKTVDKTVFVNGKDAITNAFQTVKISADTLVDTYGGNVKAETIPVPNVPTD